MANSVTFHTSLRWEHPFKVLKNSAMMIKLDIETCRPEKAVGLVP